MDRIAEASKAIFSDTGLDYKDKVDQMLAGVVSAFDCFRGNPQSKYALRAAKIAYDGLLQFEKKDNDLHAESKEKISNLKKYYTYEIKVLLIASSTGRRLQVPSDRAIRLHDHK